MGSGVGSGAAGVAAAGAGAAGTAGTAGVVTVTVGAAGGVAAGGLSASANRAEPMNNKAAAVPVSHGRHRPNNWNKVIPITCAEKGGWIGRGRASGRRMVVGK